MSCPDEPLGTNLPKSGSERAGGEFCFLAGQSVGRGRFRLERALGRGRIGTVWQAFDEQANEPVALKFLAEAIRRNPAALAAIKRETNRSRLLRHSHILRVHDFHEAEGEPTFISLEYVDGANLDDLSRERANRAFPWEDVGRWMRQLCSALSYAHSRGIIHRELTPANLMLNSRGELKLGEFGLAPALKDPGEGEDQTVGAIVPYLSPQQLAGVPAAVTDDIYSLGACLFRLLAGVPPFRGSDMRRKIASEPAPSLFASLEEKGAQRRIPEEIEEIILQCLSKNPQHRPQSANAVLELAGANLEDGETADNFSVRKGKAKSAGLTRRIASLLAIGAIAAALLLAVTLKRGSPSSVGKLSRSGALDLKSAPVRSSSFQSPNSAERAFDGFHRVITQDRHRWVSEAFPGDRSEWIAVDLGRDMRIDWIAVDWELAFAKDFSVRTRTSAGGFVEDPTQWTQQALVVGFREKGRSVVNDSESKEDVVFDFERGEVKLAAWMDADDSNIAARPIVARHVMINPTARSANNPGVYSIYEIEIGAKAIAAKP